MISIQNCISLNTQNNVYKYILNAFQFERLNVAMNLSLKNEALNVASTQSKNKQKHIQLHLNLGVRCTIVIKHCSYRRSVHASLCATL